MGSAISRQKIDLELIVKTGDVKGAGTDSNVYCNLTDAAGTKSRDILLDVKWRNDFEKGNVDVFKIRNVPNLDMIKTVELWRDEKGINDDWFVEYVKVKQFTGLQNLLENENIPKMSNRSIQDMNQNNFKQQRLSNKVNGGILPFPLNRWIKPNKKYVLVLYDSLLPQFDFRQEQRKEEIIDKRSKYTFSSKSIGLPRRVEVCPQEESFSNDYRWDIVARKFKLLAQSKINRLITSDKWDSLESMLPVYKGTFGIPYGYYNWNSDEKFGQQRLRGCNPTLIRLCKELPDNFAVTDEMLSPFLNGLTVNEAIARKELYWINLSVLEKLKCKDCRNICAPLALFHSNRESKDFLPIAIQLFQTPSETNPVFLPTDHPYTWMLAKMYFNNADCAVHQACTHLGFTHLVCESICVSVHRTLSPSHPVFRLLAPHFLYLLAINSLAVEKLLAPDGWIDVTMTMGTCGLFDVLKRRWKGWRLDQDGWLPEDLHSRGVDDTEALPNYMYRDDALVLHDVIMNYVSEVLEHVYDTPEKLVDDFEIQAWATCLSDESEGAGIKGVFGGGSFIALDNLIKTVTAIIFLSSVGHASANFCQYDEYAFPPNYPAQMSGRVPTDKEPRTIGDVISQLPNKQTTMSIMVVTKILSDRGTNPLGDFEVQYQYEPHAVQAVNRFRERLSEVSKQIQIRNSRLKDPYPYLDPAEIPNAISI